MSPNPADVLQANWRKSQCPEISGVVDSVGEGSILPVKLCLSPNETSTPAKLDRFELSSLAIWMDRPDSRWAHCCELYEIKDYSINLAVGCGEAAGNGNQGFIASSRISDGALYWIAFFPNSNPFAKCELINGRVVAHSTIGITVTVALDNPTDISLI